MAQQVIQIPPNFIVKKYKAELVVIKPTAYKIPVGIDPAQGAMVIASQTTVDSVITTQIQFKVKNSFLMSTGGDTDFYFPGFGTFFQDVIDNKAYVSGTSPATHFNWNNPSWDSDNVPTQFEMRTVSVIPGSLNPALYETFTLTIVQNTFQRYVFKVKEQFYPFPYETKHIGVNDQIEYIAMANPTFVDIDINSLFLNPQNIITSGANDTIYLLHKNV